VQPIVDIWISENPEASFPLISRRFLPFYLESLYKSVRISSDSQLAKFLSFRHDPSNLTLIEALDIHLPELKRKAEGQNDDLVALLESLANLRKLVLEGSSHLCQVFMRISHPIPPLLEHLHLHVTDPERNGSPHRFPCIFLDRLASYPRLAHLALSNLSIWIEPSLPNGRPPVRLAALNSLKLAGSFNRIPNYEGLLNRCSPTELALIGDCDEDDWSPHAIPTMLDAIRQPQLVQKLVLDTCGTISPSEFETSIARFGNLEEVTLEGKASNFAREMYQSLAALPLRHLTFGPDTQVSWWYIRDHILIPRDQQTLQTLEINHVFATRGDPTKLDESWEFPEWCTFFEEEDCEELIERTKELGIELRGTTIEAARIAEEYYDLDRRLAKDRSGLRKLEELLG